MKQEENRPMDKLKSDYESIPVPTEAKERMLAGIAQAKKEQKGVIIMKFAKKTGGAPAVPAGYLRILSSCLYRWSVPLSSFRTPFIDSCSADSVT